MRSRFGTTVSLHHLFLYLLNHFINPYLNFLLLYVFLLCIQLLPFAFLLITNIRLTLRPPSIPFVNKSFAVSDELCAVEAVFCCIFFVERTAIFPKIFPNQTLLVFCQQCAWTRSPQELLESIQDVLLKFLSAEVPYGKSVFKLPPRITMRHQKSSGTVCLPYASMNWRLSPRTDHLDPIRHQSRRSGRQCQAAECRCPTPDLRLVLLDDHQN